MINVLFTGERLLMKQRDLLYKIHIKKDMKDTKDILQVSELPHPSQHDRSSIWTVRGAVFTV